MINRLWIAIGFWLLLVGCTTIPLQEQFNESWRGSSKEDVINKFGPPERVFKDSLGNDSYSFTEQGPTDSMNFIFTFNSSGRVTFVHLKNFIENETQIERARMDAERTRKMGEAFQQMSRGSNRD